jgi:DNA-binding transcriptional LysR family regulator
MTLTQLRYVVSVAEAGSMNEAAKQQFVSQPSLSTAVRDLEEEIGVQLFLRSNHGVSITPEGKEFIGYARQVLQQYALLENKYLNRKPEKKKFSVTMQHYTFAVFAFVELVKKYGMDDYAFAVREGKTFEVMKDVKDLVSEIGILYQSSYNKSVLDKYFRDYDLSFHPLMECGVYAYVHKDHPLAEAHRIDQEELMAYPCLTFDQGMENSFYFAEEVLPVLESGRRSIKVNDRATMLNLMRGLNGYTVCCGIICEDLNGNEYKAVPIDTEEEMCIGYLCRRDAPLSDLAEEYLRELSKYREYSN